MNTKRSAASEKPQFRVVIQFTMLSGIWSRKIAQLARPRNRSRRRSRPFSGRVALTFMGRFAVMLFPVEPEAGDDPARDHDGEALQLSQRGRVTIPVRQEERPEWANHRRKAFGGFRTHHGHFQRALQYAFF